MKLKISLPVLLTLSLSVVQEIAWSQNQTQFIVIVDKVIFGILGAEYDEPSFTAKYQSSVCDLMKKGVKNPGTRINWKVSTNDPNPSLTPEYCLIQYEKQKFGNIYQHLRQSKFI